MTPKIVASSLRTLVRLQPHLREGDTYRLAVWLDELPPEVIGRLSLPTLQATCKFLPPEVGRATRVNFRGEEKVLRNGQWIEERRVIHTRWKLCGRPYQGCRSLIYRRRPRVAASPVETPFFMTTIAGERVVFTEACRFITNDISRNLRVMNLFLEVFREARILSDDVGLFNGLEDENIPWVSSHTAPLFS